MQQKTKPRFAVFFHSDGTEMNRLPSGALCVRGYSVNVWLTPDLMHYEAVQWYLTWLSWCGLFRWRHVQRCCWHLNWDVCSVLKTAITWAQRNKTSCGYWHRWQSCTLLNRFLSVLYLYGHTYYMLVSSTPWLQKPPPPLNTLSYSTVISQRFPPKVYKMFEKVRGCKEQLNPRATHRRHTHLTLFVHVMLTSR